MLKQALSVAVGLTLAGQTMANDLYLDLGPDSFHGRVDATHASNGVQYSLEGLLTNDDGQIASAGFWTYGQLGNNQAVKGGVGVKAYLGDTRDKTLTALGLGGTVNIPIAFIPGVQDLAIVTDLYYAPSITMNSYFENLVDLNVKVTWDAFENGAVYGGIRRLHADIESGHVNNNRHKFDTGPFVGIKVEF